MSWASMDLRHLWYHHNHHQADAKGHQVEIRIGTEIGTEIETEIIEIEVGIEVEIEVEIEVGIGEGVQDLDHMIVGTARAVEGGAMGGGMKTAMIAAME